MNRNLVRMFWQCGDGDIIKFAQTKAHLNRREKEILYLMLDECYTQEETAEILNISVRNVQEHWYSATNKLLKIPWLVAYAEKIKNTVNNE